MSGRGLAFHEIEFEQIGSPLGELPPVMDRRAQLRSLVFVSLSLRIYPALRLHRNLSGHRGQLI
jgi:hypothetical protein